MLAGPNAVTKNITEVPTRTWRNFIMEMTFRWYGSQEEKDCFR